MKRMVPACILVVGSDKLLSNSLVGCDLAASRNFDFCAARAAGTRTCFFEVVSNWADAEQIFPDDRPIAGTTMLSGTDAGTSGLAC
jgi:hypothetical protein